MNRYLKLSLLVLFIPITSIAISLAVDTASDMDACKKTERIVDISDFNEFGKLVDTYKKDNPELGILCCADLDNTTIEYQGYLGTGSWFSELYQGFKAKKVKDPMLTMYSAVMMAHQRNTETVQLTEPGIVAGVYGLIQSIMGIPVIGLTSRTYVLSEITKAQLLKLNVNFSHPWAELGILNDRREMETTYDPVWKAMYKPEDGIIYCSGKNKGEILKTLLERVSYTYVDQSTQQPKTINTIIVIDNNLQHLKQIKTALQCTPLNLVLVHYNSQKPTPKKEYLTGSLDGDLDFILSLYKPSLDVDMPSQAAAIKARTEATIAELTTPNVERLERLKEALRGLPPERRRLSDPEKYSRPISSSAEEQPGTSASHNRRPASSPTALTLSRSPSVPLKETPPLS